MRSNAPGLARGGPASERVAGEGRAARAVRKIARAVHRPPHLLTRRPIQIPFPPPPSPLGPVLHSGALGIGVPRKIARA